MRALRATIVLALLGLMPGCSVLFDGSDYTGGTGGPGGDAGTDAGPIACADDPDACGDSASCVEGICVPCDEDGDGFAAARCEPDGPPDCDDTDSAIHPGAIPICGNGIEESCGAAAVFEEIGLPALDELGFYPARDIQGPPDRPFRLRVRALGGTPPEARVFWQVDDGRGTIMIAEASVGAPTIQSQRLDEYTSNPLPPDTHGLGYDLQHEDDLGTAFIGSVFQDATRTVHVRGVSVRADGGWSNVDPGSIMPPAALGELTLVGQPALIRSGSGWRVGVTATYYEGGNRRSGLFRIDPTQNLFELVSGEVSTEAGVGWSHSDGRAAVFPSYGDAIVVWNGLSDGSGQDARRVELEGRLTGVPQVHQLRSAGAGKGYYTVVAPEQDGLHLVRGDCALGLPLSDPTCMFTRDAIYPTGLGNAWMTLSTVRLSESAFGMFWGDPGVAASNVQFAVLETEPLDDSMRPTAVPAPGVGNIQETAVHFNYTPFAGGGAITIVYAYIRGNEANGRVSVGAVRACSGTGI